MGFYMFFFFLNTAVLLSALK